MEKITVKSPGKLCAGLLTAFICFLQPSQIFAKSPSVSVLKELVVKKDTEMFFTAQMNGYTLYISGIEPSAVQTDLPSLPAGVKFVSSKKEEFIDESNEIGTAIHLWFSFTDTGITNLPPLIARIKNKTYYIPFESAVVYENLNLITPKLSIIFADESKIKTDKKTGRRAYEIFEGEEINFTVFIQYFVQVLNFSWTLPKNSIFSETKRWDVVNSNPRSVTAQKNDFTPEAFPLATFKWKPLLEGKYNTPDIFAEAISYSGAKKQIYVPDFEISVKKASKKDAGSQKISGNDGYSYSPLLSKAFQKPDDSFLDSEDEKVPSSVYIPTVEDCKKIAILRSEERKASIFGRKKKRENRSEFEHSIGIFSNENESGFFFFKMPGSEYGIFCGGQVYSIPEQTSTGYAVSGGQRVKITEKAGGWYYVECKAFSGWVKKSLIITIEN